ncbi:MAG: hypothetical protein A2845_05170 [Candidatus Lloydbacteria bacterium RIFCSPHIGHO2_01_FULL_49_22]|uniref:Cytochrome b5 heme-binding domain-containing protein n=1 Tax=Candidatus Lloydbacteria bacterium RIFCSPHIGHO2_01_FULL_49_22 TaxID=1798658 RepID=A0A1G2CU01_9BACT|nr:MAG: hypothetical protein A2845_05170 [Candidatus Lloydbacteria bacterium RIFCSPHIGHO2_01_FULL_49_22]OGZ09519.1 MAG: hypothetical protein A3C14_01725 [Candidatus Lloydbacteria bacterium RIFCSPHIGHO2_02_FULL_50_18]
MKKTVAIFIMSAVLFAGSTTAFASTTTDQLIAQLQQQIASLTAQVAALLEAQKSVAITQASINTTLGLLGEMSEGMTGEQVKLLQTALAGDASIYPEGKVTGYYGKLTREAVKRFQKKHGLRIDGKFDRKTAEAFEKIFEIAKKEREKNERESNKGNALPCVSAVVSGSTSSTLEDRDDDDEEDDDSDDRDNEKRYERGSKNDYRLSLPCREVGNSTTSLTMSTVTVSSVSSTSEMLAWTTNRPADAKVFYATTSPVSTTSALVWSDGTRITSHRALLSGLFANTTYYFVAESTDANNAKITTVEGSFVATGTLPQVPSTPTFTLAQVATHNTAASCYSVVSGTVYDLTSYVAAHPGGSIILAICGKDGTSSFSAQHGGQANPANALVSLKIGTFVQ